ncbi:AAA family ATPase [Mycobacterium bourgelatii]|uniref:Endonuclease GajA/Old nuclease/RecF-like AAA domain-containing protein n=1 Tax=Mycobacterium bourgelatii TaxID=1273442 RepID=A0A7I9YU69_MYCBU|nr:ATP-binding protein [Mycobacterium bourgelatii]MCV6977574.1 AAA family ATPase [Mycobacterium bourgelatii]GFG92117.1 hypothetical protein MBOU_41590 [Mycobacterium bourgelatii]
MKLHRLVLSNYRGIAHRDIEFPEHGVVVVSGANETGKSSMIEALDLLLECKDRSTKKEIKRVKPTNADVGSEVMAEISSGPYRFVYRKRFNKMCETELTVLAPRREQLTGDEAHERVQAILDETVDTQLWRAQRVLQAESTGAVDLSGCNALSRALDIAAGDEATLSGTEPLLIERIDNEYGRYFTPTGRPTGEWAAAISRLAEAEARVAQCAAAVAEVDDRVRRHEELTLQVAELSQQLDAAGPRLEEAKAKAKAITALADQEREAKLVVAAAAATAAGSTAAHAARQALLNEIGTRTTTVTALEAETQQAAAQQEAAQTAAKACDAAAAQAAQAVTAAQCRVDAARGALEQVNDREEADRLSARLAKIDDIQRRREQIGVELSTIAITDEIMRRIEDAAAAVDRVDGQLALISAGVEFTAATDIELVVADQRVSLTAGQSWSLTATSAAEVEIPGIVTARITPGATALDMQAKYVAAQNQLDALLQEGKVGDVAAARSTDQRRRELQNTRDQLTATLTGLCGDEQVDQLRERLAQLRADLPAEPDLFTGTNLDGATARTELVAAVAARADAQAECERQRQAAADANRELSEISTKAAVLQNKLAAERAELEAATARLTDERAKASDSDLAAKVQADQAALQAAEAKVAELAEALAATAPDAVAAELKEAAETVDNLRQNHETATNALREVSIELSWIGSEGRRGKLDAAETEREHAAGQYARIGRRARAAKLLREVMTRHRETTRQRYVEPYRAELHKLGRPVFGPTFEVDVDSNLCIRGRTLDNVTVPYESLSGGAKEQLGILARLAGAALVAKEDTVPVVVDDALGFTDPDRLAKMGEVFDAVGAHGQVIVLTCSPDRYEGVKGAHRIELGV